MFEIQMIEPKEHNFNGPTYDIRVTMPVSGKPRVDLRVSLSYTRKLVFIYGRDGDRLFQGIAKVILESMCVIMNFCFRFQFQWSGKTLLIPDSKSVAAVSFEWNFYSETILSDVLCVWFMGDTIIKNRLKLFCRFIQK